MGAGAVSALAAATLFLAVPAGVEATPDVSVTIDVRYGTADGRPLLLDVYLPATPGGGRSGVVLVHGGAWRGGDKADFAVEARRLAAAGLAAFSVNYRLDTIPAFPAQVDDVQAAVHWVRTHAGEYGVDPSRIGALGASAGGHLVGMLATEDSGPLDQSARIRVGVSWSGPMDLTLLAGPRGVPGLTTSLFTCRPVACPEDWSRASPVDQVDAGDAPMLLINSAKELVPIDQASVMADRLRAAGVDHRLDVIPGTRHAHDFRDDVWNTTVEFLRTRLESPPAPLGLVPGQAGETRGGSSREGGRFGQAIVTGALIGLVVGALVTRSIRRRRRRASPPAAS